MINIIESILFAKGEEVSKKDLIKALNLPMDEFNDMVFSLIQKFNKPDSGIKIIDNGFSLKMVTDPQNSVYVEQFIKSEIGGDLTKPQLETLTIIAYLGPITKPELDELRGVNCALILKNLLMRGLIEEQNLEDYLLPVFILSNEALEILGVVSVQDLPDYEKIRNNEHLLNLKNNELCLNR